MLRFSANISMLFLERPTLDRPRAAQAAGFGAVEIQFPYEHEPERWAEALTAAGVGLAVINMPVGDLLTGGPGLACVPGREAPFRQAVHEAARWARVLRPRQVNVLAGWPDAGLERAACFEVLARNLAFAAEVLGDLGVGVTIEAANTRDRPGYFIANTADALHAIDLAGHPNLRIQYDLYHMHIMEGDLAGTLGRTHERIGHIQFADHPGRHEPGTGEIDFASAFAAIERLPYDGFVGAEYVPSRRTEETLGWLRANPGRA
jgi:hydroxypyruvate isomerase